MASEPIGGCISVIEVGGPNRGTDLIDVAEPRNREPAWKSLSWLIERTSRTPPLSLPLDRRALYFDCRHSLRLEELLKTYDHEEGPALMVRARAGIALLTESGISSIMARVSARRGGPGEKTRKRVLVAGQVEDHASIRYGCLSRMTNNDLVRLAACEQADAQILYKPHPDVLARRCAPSTTPTRSPRLRASRRSYAASGLPPPACPFYSGWVLDERPPADPPPRAALARQGPTPPKWRILASS